MNNNILTTEQALKMRVNSAYAFVVILSWLRKRLYQTKSVHVAAVRSTRTVAGKEVTVMTIEKKDVVKLVDVSRKFWTKGVTGSIADALSKERFIIAEKIAVDAVNDCCYKHTIKDIVDVCLSPYGFKRNATYDEICDLFKCLGFTIITKKRSRKRDKDTLPQLNIKGDDADVR